MRSAGARAAAWRLAACAAAVLGCAACAGGASSPDGDGCGLSSELEVQVPGGAWQSIASAPPAQLVLGFQGFLMVYARVHVSASPPAVPSLVTLHVDGYPAYSQALPPLSVSDTGGGHLASDLFALFFNNESESQLVGRVCDLALRIGDGGCGLASSGRITFVTLEGCIGYPDGRVDCPDAGR